ncbi:hypothetical protein NDU88_009762 [Pleurodeles waltl]|uniref:Uncharacterized protein n=1 Tax=Pleurodeles waltl TaxID=8319 RepID=A0AAV7PWR3_PLEWA|nr:hypothetical protein NDU88_009762 [Pleurodeles waltl]
MDLVQGEAQKTLRPARNASDGVAAAIRACSPLRRVRSARAQVRSGRQGGHGASEGAERDGRGAHVGSSRCEDTPRKTWHVERELQAGIRAGGARAGDPSTAFSSA